jgi:hypothetical protein
MKKLVSKIDFTLAFRLILSAAMFYTAYQQNDITTLMFGLFLAIYAIIGNKYRVGCGYNGCSNMPKNAE